MADGKLGEGRRTEDRRGTGRARRVSHTVSKDSNNQTGDKRSHPYAPKPMEGMSTGRSVPIAQTLGGETQSKSNGSGKRSTPVSMKVGEW